MEKEELDGILDPGDLEPLAEECAGVNISAGKTPERRISRNPIDREVSHTAPLPSSPEHRLIVAGYKHPGRGAERAALGAEEAQQIAWIATRNKGEDPLKERPIK